MGTALTIAAALALAGCGGEEKTEVGLAEAVTESGVTLNYPVSMLFAKGNDVCRALDAGDIRAAWAYAGNGGEAPMRVAVEYLCPDQLASWDVTTKTARDLK